MKTLLPLLLFLLTLCTQAQEAVWTPVPGVPSREVYDLLFDSRGYLWLGHNAGISRYDGQHFVNYSNRQQNGRSISDLFEDRQGRIWCHNFEGQIFYMENGQLHLLSSFDAKQEKAFSRIAIYGDELVATSTRGFFTCNTRTMRARYYDLPQAATTLTVFGGGVVLYLPHHGFWIYRGGASPRPLASKLHLPDVNTVFQGQSSGDTAFLFLNPLGTWYRVWLQNDSMQVSAPQQAGEYINTFSVDGKDVWLHTNSLSRSRSDTMRNGWLSDVATDRSGNRFFSSLRYGLLVQHRSTFALMDLPFLQPKEVVRCFLRIPGGLLYGTEQANVYLQRNGRVRRIFAGAARLRAVNSMVPLDDETVLVGMNNGLVRVDLGGNRNRILDSSLSVKEVAVGGGQVAVATNFGCITKPVSYFLTTPDVYALQVNIFDAARPKVRTVCYAPKGKLYLTFNNGTYEWAGNAQRTLLVNGEPVYGTRIRPFAGRLLFGTINRGLLQLSGDTLRPLPIAVDGRLPVIPNLLTTQQRAWVLYENQVEELDTAFHPRILTALPFLGSAVTDLMEIGDTLLAATTLGLYRRVKNNNTASTLRSYVDGLRINDGQLLPRLPTLSHHQNTISLHLSTPYFDANRSLRYRYRISAEGSTGWLLSEEDQSVFLFANLPPGSYTFSAIAVDEVGTALAPEVSYSFTIDPPWWGAWWARLGLVLLLTTLFFLLGLYGQRRRARRQRARYEKMLAVEHERQRISAEIHDDLGATLSGVRLLTELAREKMPPGPLRGDLEKIHQSITSLTEKTREVIWTLNTEQDSVESLLLYIQKAAQHLFEASPIQLQVQLPVELPGVRISGDVRRHVYLAVKEALHNCLKHSGATWCRLQLQCPEGRLHITVQDNGRGIPTQGGNGSFSSGMRTMQQRMAYAGGSLHLHSNEYGTQIDFVIPVNHTI